MAVIGIKYCLVNVLYIFVLTLTKHLHHSNEILMGRNDFIIHAASFSDTFFLSS